MTVKKNITLKAVCRKEAKPQNFKSKKLKLSAKHRLHHFRPFIATDWYFDFSTEVEQLAFDGLYGFFGYDVGLVYTQKIGGRQHFFYVFHTLKSDVLLPDGDSD